MGRKGNLKTKITLDEAVQRVKDHLQLKSIRLAKSPGKNLDCKELKLLFYG
jgi:putative NIF3 family GTP cyclohydrolase 1 type 2